MTHNPTRVVEPRWSHGYRTRKEGRLALPPSGVWRRLWTTLACVTATTENNLFLEFFSSSNVKCDDFKKETRWEQIARTRPRASGFSLTAVRATKSTRVELTNNSSARRHRNQLTLRPLTRINLPMLLDIRTTAAANVSVDHARRPTSRFSPQASALNRPQPSHCPSHRHRGLTKAVRAPVPWVRRPASRSESESHWTFRLTTQARPVQPSTPSYRTTHSRPSAATTTTHRTWSSYWTSPHNCNRSPRMTDKQNKRMHERQVFNVFYKFLVSVLIFWENYSSTYQRSFLINLNDYNKNISKFSSLENMLHRQNWLNRANL